MQRFQMWVDLPAADKMCAPRYQNINTDDVPVVTTDDGTLSGSLLGLQMV